MSVTVEKRLFVFRFSGCIQVNAPFLILFLGLFAFIFDKTAEKRQEMWSKREVEDMVL